MAEFCAICGARLSDNNVTGIGYECMAALKAAKAYKAKKQGIDFQLWVIRAQEVRKLYLECCEGANFRSSFRKSFHESMLHAERISAKQLKVMEDYIVEKQLSHRLTELNKAMDAKRDAMIDAIEVTIEEINASRQFVRTKKANKQD